MSVRRESGGTLDEAVIGCSRIGVCCGTSIIKRSENAGRAAFLDKVAHNLVIEVLDGRPLDLLADVLLLLRLESELDEDLL